MSVTTASDGFKGPGLLTELGIGRAASFLVLLVLAVALQSTVLNQITILGVKPQLSFVVVVSLAYLDGERMGVLAGFFAGLFQDFLLPASIIGLTAFVYTLIGYGVGRIRQYRQSESVWTPVLTVAGASAGAEVGYASLSIILGQSWVGLAYTLKVAGLVVLYNTLLTPFAFPFVDRVTRRFRPERVQRW